MVFEGMLVNSGEILAIKESVSNVDEIMDLLIELFPTILC